MLRHASIAARGRNFKEDSTVSAAVHPDLVNSIYLFGQNKTKSIFFLSLSLTPCYHINIQGNNKQSDMEKIGKVSLADNCHVQQCKMAPPPMAATHTHTDTQQR